MSNPAEKLKEWVEAEKHLMGQHNQKRHGWRFGSTLGYYNAKRRVETGQGISSDYQGKTTPEAELEAMIHGGRKGSKKYGGMTYATGFNAAHGKLEVIKSGLYGSNRQEVIEGLTKLIKSERQRHDDFLSRAEKIEKGDKSVLGGNPGYIRQQTAKIMTDINGYSFILKNLQKGKDYIQDQWGQKYPVEYGKMAAPKPIRAKKPATTTRRTSGDSTKVDPNLARRAIQMANGDKKAAYSRVVQLTSLRPGFDNKDLQAWLEENGY